MQSIIDFLKNCFNAVINALSSIISFFVDFFKSLGDLLYDSLHYFFFKLRDDLGAFIFTVIEDSIDGAFGHGSTVWVTDIYNTINFFVPLDFLMSTLLVLLSVWSSILIVKVLLKIIPTVY